MADPVVLVVGAGPAGLRAVEALVAGGIRPILVDEAERPGGQIYRQPPPGAERPAKDLYGFEAPKAERLHALLAQLGERVDYRPRTLVWNIADRQVDLIGPRGHESLTVDRMLLATGAMDRIIPFPGWTLPGVFTLGGAQIALKAQGVAIGRRVAFVGAGPLLPLVVHQYAKAGAEIAAVLDVTPFAAKAANLPRLLAQPATLAKGLWYTGLNALRGLRGASGVQSIAVEGEGRVERLTWVSRAGARESVSCDAVAASFGLRSEIQLADLAGCALAFDSLTRQWVPTKDEAGRSSQPHVYLAGDGSGIGGADMAELSGERAALALLQDSGRNVDENRVRTLAILLARQARFRQGLEAAYPYPAHLLDNIADEEIVCRCENIRAGAIRAAAAERDVKDINRLKAFTRLGMGRCQGRVCGQAGAEILARATGCNIADVGRLRGNPPVKPFPLALPEAAE